MKKGISLLLIITILFTLAACGKKSNTPEATAPAGTTAPAAPVAETEAPTEAPTEPAPRLYGEIMDAYYDALIQGFTPDQYNDKGLNYMPGMVKDIAKVGYCLEDLDNDGIPELLIGEVGQPEIFAMYTIVNGAETMVLNAGERSVYWMTSDGFFVNRGSSSAAKSGYLLNTFVGGALVYQNGLIFDGEANADAPWFYAEDEDWDVSNDSPIDTDEAESIVDTLEEDKLPIAYMAFSEYTH